MKFILILILMLFCLPLLSQADNKVIQPPAGSENRNQKKKVPDKQKTKSDKTSPVKASWPPPFNPTEKIKADSMVSFPTDI